MFEKLKQIQELKKMQDELKKERLMAEKEGVQVTMDGSFEVHEVRLNPHLRIDEQQMAVRDAINEAREKIQKQLAQKMMGGGFGL